MTQRLVGTSVLMVILSAFVVLLAQEAAERRKDPAGTQPATTAATSTTDFGAESYRLVDRPDEIVSVLKNGMVVITKRMTSPVTSVRGYVKAGSIYEGKWLGGGLSHLLEHMVAGGANQRRTEEQNRDLLQDIGNNSNAYTYFDRTAYFVNTTTDNAEKAVDLVSGWMLGAKIPLPEYQREYEVVQRELEMYEGQGEDVFGELSLKNRYRISPAALPIVGFQEVIRGLTRDDVYAYYQLAYVPNNMIFVVVGDRDPQQLLAMVQKHVKDARPGRVFSHDITPEPPVTGPRTLVATFPKLGQAHVQLAFPSMRILDDDLYATDLLATVLGGGESSILVEEIRDKQQLVTDISCSNFTPAFVEGTLAIDFRCEPAKVDQATKAVLEIVDRAKTTPIDPERIARARSQFKSALVMGRQTAEAIADSLADGYLNTGDPHFQDRYLERVGKQTPGDMTRVAAKYFDISRLITTTMLPEEAVGAGGLPKAQQIVARAKSATTAPSATPASEEVHRSVLDDGTVLLVKRLTATPMVTMNLFALGGLTAEGAKTNGLGNLAMSLLERGAGQRDALSIVRELDAMGAQFGATCGNNSWIWKAACLKEDFARMMALYGQLVNEPTFPQDEIEPMRQRILAGIESQDSDWYAQANRFFKKVYFGPADSPYQFNAIGSAETVKGFTREQIKQWYEKTVLPAPRVLAIYGDVDIAQARALSAKILGSAAKRPLPPECRAAASAATRPPAPPAKRQVDVLRVEVQKTSNPQAGVIIGFVADAVIGESDWATFDVADCLTSGYGAPTGYIFEILRGRGLVYTAGANHVPGLTARLPGAFIAFAGCEPKNVTQVAETIIENVARLQGSDEEIQANWFARCKSLIATGQAVDRETPAAQAQAAALDELFGLGYGYDAQLASRVNAVKLDDVRRVAASRLNRCVIAISTPAPEAVRLSAGIRNYDRFPPVDLTPKGVQHDTPQGSK